MTEINRYRKNQRMSQIVVHNGLVYLAGQVASTAPGESIETQTKNVLDKIDTYLNEVGSQKGNILSANIWLSSIKDFDSMNKIWDKLIVNNELHGVESQTDFLHVSSLDIYNNLLKKI